MRSATRGGGELVVPAVAGGILRRPQASASALGSYDSVNCLDLCLDKKNQHL